MARAAWLGADRIILKPAQRSSSVEAILHLERPAPGHLHWPDLDVDLAIDSIEHPERYPLKSKA